MTDSQRSLAVIERQLFSYSIAESSPGRIKSRDVLSGMTLLWHALTILVFAVKQRQSDAGHRSNLPDINGATQVVGKEADYRTHLT